MDMFFREKNGRQYFNCAGYALNTYTWYQFDVPFFFNFKSKPLRVYINQLLKDFPKLKVVDKDYKTAKNERLIAFRVGDRDFHFRVKKGRCWYEKIGGYYDLLRVKKKDMLNDKWTCPFNEDLIYDSEVIFFALEN